MSMGPEKRSFSREPMAPKEIERKWVVDSVPKNVLAHEGKRIRQGYLVIGADGSEARLRDKGGQFTLTVKTAGDMSRGEWEAEISQEQFDTLWPATEGKRIEKIRRTVPVGEVVAELDVYEGKLEGLMVVEVEFPDIEAAENFVPPDWFGSDVTSEKGYKNQRLALDGPPSSL